MAQLTKTTVGIKFPGYEIPGTGFKLPSFNIEGEWQFDQKEKEAAWELYIELATRITTQELAPDEGLLREALSSLYSLFSETRKILREKGPSVARPKGKGQLSLGYIAVTILNSVLRPVLAYWHPTLKAYEETRPQGVSPVQHERKWERSADLRRVLNEIRQPLCTYADYLAKAAGVPPIESSPRHPAR